MEITAYFLIPLLFAITLWQHLQLKSLNKRLGVETDTNVKSSSSIRDEINELHALYGFLVKNSNRTIRRKWARTINPRDRDKQITNSGSKLLVDLQHSQQPE